MMAFSAPPILFDIGTRVTLHLFSFTRTFSNKWLKMIHNWTNMVWLKHSESAAKTKYKLPPMVTESINDSLMIGLVYKLRSTTATARFIFQLNTITITSLLNSKFWIILIGRQDGLVINMDQGLCSKLLKLVSLMSRMLFLIRSFKRVLSWRRISSEIMFSRKYFSADRTIIDSNYSM